MFLQRDRAVHLEHITPQLFPRQGQIAGGCGDALTLNKILHMKNVFLVFDNEVVRIFGIFPQ